MLGLIDCSLKFSNTVWKNEIAMQVVMNPMGKKTVQIKPKNLDERMSSRIETSWLKTALTNLSSSLKTFCPRWFADKYPGRELEERYGSVPTIGTKVPNCWTLTYFARSPANCLLTHRRRIIVFASSCRNI